MRKYVLYIDTEYHVYNITNIFQEELQEVINAYQYGKTTFFVGGKKYSFLALNEIKIYEIKIENFDEWFKATLDTVKKNRDTNFLLPSILESIGSNVTRFFIKNDFGSGMIENTLTKLKNDEMDIFISHSSEDVTIAKNLIDLIRKALNIESGKIRCTSVNGYKLPGGASTEEHLKKEIYNSKVFIAIITSHSINSTFVLFELGARWSIEAPLLPLICDQAGTSLLSGPLKNINALNANNSSDILQFLEDLSRHLETKMEPSSSFLAEVEILNNSIRKENKQEKEDQFSNSQFNEIDNTIKNQAKIKWPDNFVMQLDEINSQRAAVEILKKGRPSDLTEEEFFKIRERSKQSWPLDFVMQEDEETRQIESLRELKRM